MLLHQFLWGIKWDTDMGQELDVLEEVPTTAEFVQMPRVEVNSKADSAQDWK